jgi:hypothetical protein
MEIRREVERKVGESPVLLSPNTNQ